MSGRCVPPLYGLLSATDVARAAGSPPRRRSTVLDALAHCAQMHGHMRRVGDQVARAVEDRAGEIQPFLDVHAQRGVLQHDAGLLGHAHEQVVEQLQQHRVRPRGAGGAAGGAPGPPRNVRRSSMWSRAVTSAVQPGSTTVVALASRTSAGPGSTVARPATPSARTPGSGARPPRPHRPCRPVGARHPRGRPAWVRHRPRRARRPPPRPAPPPPAAPASRTRTARGGRR